MKIFYHCFGSSHSSVIAANIHVGNLPQNRIPSWKEINSIPHFDRTQKKQIGEPFYIGKDESNNEVYIVGLTHKKNIPLNAVDSLASIFSLPKRDYVFVDALPSINRLAKFGGFLSRGMGLVFIGRPLAIFGIQTSYKNLLHLVEQTKKYIAANPS